MALILVCISFAQEAPKAEVFGGYSYLNVDTEGLTNRLNFNGFDVNATYYANRYFGIEGDFAGHFQGNCADSNGIVNQILQDNGIAFSTNIRCRDFALMGGPKVAYRTGKFTAFGHALFGADSVAISATVPDLSVSVSQMRWSMATGGGVDWSVSRRYAIRVAQFDYFLTNHNGFFGGTHQNHFRVSAGIVFKFGNLGGAMPVKKSGGPQQPSRPLHSESSGNAIHIDQLGATVQSAGAGRGLEIKDVDANGAAAKAGLRNLDEIVSVNGVDVYTPEELQSALAKAGDLTISYRYLGTPQYRTVTIKQ
jgi:hypothetical protein